MRQILILIGVRARNFFDDRQWWCPCSDMRAQYSDDTKRGGAYLHVVSDIANIWKDWFLPQNEDELRNYLLARGIKLKPT